MGLTRAAMDGTVPDGRRSWQTTSTPTDRHRDDGSTFRAPLGIRLAQVMHHGTDHRSQICTALTTLGIEPPEVDVWDFGHAQARVDETPPPSALTAS